MRGLKPIFLIVAGLLVASCGGKLKLDASLDANLKLKKDLKVEVKKKEPPPPEKKEFTTQELITQAVDAENRPVEDKVRDQYRHPVETLQFFGLDKGMTVLEIAPGQGWYTRILAPVLKEKGKLIVTSVDVEADPESEATKAALAYEAMLEQNKAEFGDVEIHVVKDDNVLGAPESVDMVLSFRNNHFWAKAKKQEAKIYKAIFNVLKPGGTFGMVHHRADAKTKVRAALNKGYLPEQYVIDRALAAGFELVEKSEVNANPKDTKDYGRGVWSLPPVLAYGEEDREKYLEIGESDRMTLLFKKPASADKASDGATAKAEAKEDADANVEAKDDADAAVKDEKAAVKDEKKDEKAAAKDEKKDEKAAVKDEKKDEKAAAKDEKKDEKAAVKDEKKDEKAAAKDEKAAAKEDKKQD